MSRGFDVTMGTLVLDKKPDRSMQEDSIRPDSELFAKHLAGDHESFMILFNRYHRRIYLYCLKFLGDRELAQDLSQQFWEKAIRLRKKNIEPPLKVKGYLLRMARNLCLNHFRSQRQTVSIDDLSERELPSNLMGEDVDMKETIDRALACLPENRREVLVLNFYFGYSFDEIAELMGKKVGAVYVMAWRARKELAKILLGFNENEDSDRDQK